jgi:O-antigen ligase
MIVRDYQDNPLLGAGFDTFWAGKRLVMLAESTFGIIQAHNGYIETYLNGGLVGVVLLVGLLLSTYWRTRKNIVTGTHEDSMRYTLLLVALIYNFSEASFNKPGILWLATMFAILEYPKQARWRHAELCN